MRLRHPSPAAARRLFALAWLLVATTSVASGWFLYGRAPNADTGRAYIEGVLGQPERVNPLLATPDSPDADLVALVFSGLTRPRGDGTPEPDLAESWSVTPDGLRYTFRLRSALFWHDGAALTAEDVAFTVGRVQEPGFRGLPALAAEWNGIGTEVVDERTVAFTLQAPTATFLTTVDLPILPRHLLADVAPADWPDIEFNQHPVGSGPYRLRELTRSHALLEANANFHRGTPAIHSLQLRFYRDEAALAMALEQGEVSAAVLPTFEGSASRAASARTDLATSRLPLAGYTVLYFNNQRPPLDETRTRVALAAAIDRAALLGDVFGGRGTEGASPIVPGSWAASNRTTVSTSGSAGIDELFASAGWLRGQGGIRERNGERLSLTLQTNAEATRARLAEAVANQLRAAGVEVDVTTVPGQQFVQQRLQPREFQLAIFGWDAGPDPDPYGAWHTSQITGGGRNFAGLHDPTTDALLERARATLDQVERAELYRQFEVRFAAEAPSVILHYPVREYVHPIGLRGLDTGLQFDAASRFRGLDRWQLAQPPR
ncbi:MAG: peptide ABC transporter substrate-binding protein [Dehalococcoidia bacterium]|nr:peptide ABC transporter substrate-binding protein [Dehalococcoidia bacterium]